MTDCPVNLMSCDRCDEGMGQAGPDVRVRIAQGVVRIERRETVGRAVIPVATYIEEPGARPIGTNPDGP